MRLGIVAGVIVTLLVAGACASPGATVAPPDLTPVPGAVEPVPQGSFGPATIADVTGALDALDALASYRFSVTRGVPATKTQGIVINGTPHRVRTDTMSGGVVGMSMIQIGDQSWMSFAGSPYQGDPFGAGGPDDPAGAPIGQDEDWFNPILSEVDGFMDGLGSMTDLGVELRDGVAARHLRALGTGQAVLDEEGDPLDSGFEGVVDAWIAVDGGYLRGLRAVGASTGFAFPDEPSPDAEPVRVEISISGANDAANRVDEPVVPDPTVLPSGDPAIVALLDGMGAGLAKLDAFVLTLSSGAAGASVEVTITVVNRPVPSLMMATGSIAGSDGLSTLIIGDKAWSREGDGPWTPDSEGGLGGLCDGTRPGAGAGLAGCVTDSILGMDGMAATAGAFVIADPDEAVDGVSTTHLHSASGMPSAGMSIPGTMDLWIANEGGYLVRYAFEGQGLGITLDIGRINDPTIVITAPPAASPTPGG